MKSGNSILNIELSIISATLAMVTDHKVDMVDEPLVSGVPQMLQTYLNQISGTKGQTYTGEYTLQFSDSFFPSAGHLVHLRNEGKGAWYTMGEEVGWLCGCILHYYETPPKEIYFHVLRK